jgi:molybdopterin-guanine dinucleotide biosynthesis protein A
MPLMTAEVIRYLIEYPTDKLITIARADNFIQQLCGVYHKSLIPNIEKIIGKNNTGVDERNPRQNKRGCSMLELVKSVDSKVIDIEKEYRNYRPGTFYNMNRPEEYSFIKEMLS